MTDFKFSKRFRLCKTFVSCVLKLAKTKIVVKTYLNNAVRKMVYKKENNNRQRRQHGRFFGMTFQVTFKKN